MKILLLIIAIITSVIGSICGIGGGVLIKPLLDAMNIMSVSSISFLTGCCVLSMTIVSVGKSIVIGKTKIKTNTTLSLGIGAAIGGAVGKGIFSLIRDAAGNEAVVGLVQAAMLALVTIATLIYMILNSHCKIKNMHITNPIFSIIIGLTLGIVSSFLGIGGGPINLAFLAFFFSMNTKEAAINSLCVILISQITSLLQTLLTRSVPEFHAIYLMVMIIGGVVGGFIGQGINRKLSVKRVDTLFNLAMILVIAVSVYNTVRFGILL